VNGPRERRNEGRVKHDPARARLIERMLTASPFHHWLGLRLVEVTEEGVEIALPWREELVAHTKRFYTHGGVIASLVDLTADMAIVAAFGRDVPTVDLRVDYHRATVKEELRAVGRTIKIGRTFATAEATIYNPEDKLVASGRGVFLTQKVEGA